MFISIVYNIVKRDSDYNNKEISFDVAKVMKFILYLSSLLLLHF